MEQTEPQTPETDRWSADVVLADGTTVRVRPITPADARGLVSFHERQSSESIYYRFFSPRPRLSDDEVRHLSTVDGVNRMAFVAERGGELIGVARYDRYGDRPVAEVAFFTDDAHGGRGIATLLLEYLAAHAREVGIVRFEAHVLPANRRMVGVFQQAGFDVSSTFADGVIEVTLDIEPDEAALAAMAERATAAERQSVVRLLEPRSIAVVGAGRGPSGIGHRVLRNLLATPFAGPVHPINPDARSVAGVRAHRSVLDVGDQIDLAVVCVPAAEVAGVIEECGRARIGAAVVISAGFAEAGRAGADAQVEVLATARRYGVRILGPNCLGVINTDPDVALRATFADVDPLPGRVGLLSQSGTLGAVILDRARRSGVGISSFVAVGNKADLSGNDMLLYWLDDTRTDVVLLYLESFGNPRRFGRNVRRVAADKPVFAVRSGAALDEGDEGWLDDATIGALLRQTGVVRVPTIAALLDAALVAQSQPVPAGHRTVVVGNGGGGSSMAADACLDAGLSLAELSADTMAAIDDVRLHGRRATNPVDLRYDADPGRYEAVLDAVLVDPSVDVALVVHAPYTHDEHEGLIAVLDRMAGEHPTTTIVACIYGDHPPLTRGGVPVFDFPDEAAHALGSVVRYGLWRSAEGSGEVLGVDDPDAVAARARAELATASHRVLDPRAARDLLAVAGVPTVPVHVLDGPDDAHDVDRFEFGQAGLDGDGPPRPVALKSESHRPGATTQRAGVALDLHSADQVRSALSTMAESLGADAWPMVVQPMVESGIDVRIAVETHPIVGPVVRVGPGGGAGRYADSPRRVLPLTDLGAEELVDDSGVDDQLDPAARAALVSLVRSLAAVVDAAPEIVALVCDPVIVRSDSADVVDVRVVLAADQADVAPTVRRV